MRQAGKLGRFAGSTGGWATMAIGLGASFLTNPEDKREGLTINNGAQIVSGIGDLVSKFNPIGLGISTLVNLVSNENKGLDRLTHAVGATLASPVRDIVTGVGKIFGQNEKNNRLVAYLNDVMRVYTGTMQRALPTITEAGKERLKKSNEKKINERLGNNKAISKLLEGEEFHDPENLRKLIEEAELDLQKAESGDKEMKESDYLRASELIEQLKPQLSKLEATRYIAQNMDVSKYALAGGSDLIQKGYYRNFGLSAKNDNKDFFVGRLMEHGRSKEQAEEQYKAMLASYGKATVMNEEGLQVNMTEEGKLNAMTKDFIEMLEKEDETARKQQEELAHQTTLQQNMAKYDKTIMENSMAQTTALNLLAQKTALDILKETGAYDKHFDSEGNVKTDSNGDWKIAGIPTAMAGSLKAVFSM